MNVESNPSPNQYYIVQRWYHLDVSFTGKKDNVASQIVYHNRDVYDIKIECANHDNEAILPWTIPSFIRLNIYARSGDNREVQYIVNNTTKDGIHNIYLYLPELNRFPYVIENNSTSQENRFYRLVRLEINYDLPSFPNFNKSNIIKLRGTKCSITRPFLNRGEYKITVPYGWRIDTQKLYEAKKIDSEIKEMEGNIHSIKIKNYLKKSYTKLTSLYSSKNIPNFTSIYLTKDNSGTTNGIIPTIIKIPANPELITDIYSTRLEYSFVYDYWDKIQEKDLERIPNTVTSNIKLSSFTTLDFVIKAKKSLIVTQYYPVVYALLSLGIVAISLFINYASICVDSLIAPLALCIANLNLGVFSYFTYHKLVSLGYSYKSNRLINLSFLLGFVFSILAIIFIVILHFSSI